MDKGPVGETMTHQWVNSQVGRVGRAGPAICGEAMVFPMVIYGCESWTLKKAEHQRIDAFELWCWRRLFRVPWTARRSNQDRQSIFRVVNVPCNTIRMDTYHYTFEQIYRRYNTENSTVSLGEEKKKM